MEQTPPSPPRTIIVVDDHPSDVSFICSVLEAHALPYAVQVIEPGAPAFDPFAHLAQPESQRAPTLILLDRTRPQRARQLLWRRLTALWPTVMLPRVRRRWPQRHTAARSSTPQRLRWPRRLAWSVGLGLLVGIVSGAPWLPDRLQRVPISPPPRSDHMAAALLSTVVPAAPPAAEVRPPAQSQTPAAHTRINSTAPGGTPAHGPHQRPPTSVGQNAADLRPPAANQPRASRAAHVRHTRRRYAPLRPAPLRHLVTVRDGAPTAMVAGRS
jgi:CheY-like chemotaxis protein